MSDLLKIQQGKRPMDQTDIAYIVELLSDALLTHDWDTVIEANEQLKEYMSDDGSPFEIDEEN